MSRSWSVNPIALPSRRRTTPAAAEPRRAAVQPRLQVRVDRTHQTRTSTTGIDGTSPAAKPARLVADPITVEANRNVELEPGRHRRPRRRRRHEMHLPVIEIDREPRAAASGTPDTATRTVPATGFVTGRT